LVPEGFSRADAERQFRMMMAHEAAARAYRIQPLTIPLTVFAAEEEAPGRVAALTQAWQPFAAAGLRVNGVPGAHMSLMRPPYVGELGRQLRQCMDQ